jgi:hypothetical protein
MVLWYHKPTREHLMNTDFNIIANCTRKTPSKLSPSQHSGTCKVWALHHHLTEDKPVEILRTMDTIIHVGLWTPSRDVDSKATRARITKGARQYAKAHGYSSCVMVSSGATLGPVESETRLIFSMK